MAKSAPPVHSLVGLHDDYQLTLADVGRILKIDSSTAWELVTGGAMPFLRHGKQTIRVEVQELRKYIDSVRVSPRAPIKKAG